MIDYSSLSYNMFFDISNFIIINKDVRARILAAWFCKKEKKRDMVWVVVISKR